MLINLVITFMNNNLGVTLHVQEGSQLLLERTVLAQATMIDNPWLPHLHYAFQDETQLHLVMDYEPGGDMYIFLNK